jgi:uncharacterized membrane protein YfcA
MHEVELGKLLLLMGVGVIAGVLNILAGGGSLLTLPVLIFLGLPAAMANGTNRIAIFFQNVVAVGSFRQKGKLPLRLALLCTPSALLGSVVGARLAITISDILFKQILAGVMLGVVVLMVVDPARRLNLKPRRLSRARAAGLVAIFFFIGIYGGFIQAGVGLLMIPALLLQGLDLVRINAIKVFVVLVFTVAAIVVFVLHDQVDYGLGFTLAVGNMLGGWLGTKIAVKGGHGFIRKFVIAVVVVFSAKLLWPS